MSKAHAAVTGAVAHTRRARAPKPTTGKPHTRKSALTFPVNTIVVDAITSQLGVILSGKKTHVHTASA